MAVASVNTAHIANGSITSANLGSSANRWGSIFTAPTIIHTTQEDVFRKYFEVKGDVRTYAKEFMDIISRLYGIDDNFKAVKLYGQLRKGLHKEFVETLKKYQPSAPAYSFSSDSDTGFYSTGGSISFSVGVDNSDADKLTIK